jgi:hypothetical protein
MAKHSAHIRRHLRASTAAAALLEEIERREQLLGQVRQKLPDALAQHCCQAALDAGELTLFVDSSVWVDRFRFLGSDLITDLATCGLVAKRCRVRVLPSAPYSQSSVHGAKPSPRRVDHSMETHESDSELARALARLAHTLGRDGAG